MFFSDISFNNPERDASYIGMRQCSSLNNRVQPYDFPHLWTDAVTDCLAVGLFTRNPDDHDYKIELYHSVSEHYYDEKKINTWLEMGDYNKTPQPLPFVHCLYQFLKNATNTSPDCFMIVIANIDDDFYFHQKDIKNTVNFLITYFNLNQIDTTKHLKLIDNNNFKIIAKTENLAITRSGGYGSRSQIFCQSLSSIFDMLKSRYDCISINPAEKKYTDGVFQIFRELQSLETFFKLKDHHALHVNIGEKFFSHKWNEIKSIANRYLIIEKNGELTGDIESQLLYLKIIAWNPFNNQADEAQLNKWLAKSKYPITDDIKIQIFKAPELAITNTQPLTHSPY